MCKWHLYIFCYMQIRYDSKFKRVVQYNLSGQTFEFYNFFISKIYNKRGAYLIFIPSFLIRIYQIFSLSLPPSSQIGPQTTIVLVRCSSMTLRLVQARIYNPII